MFLGKNSNKRTEKRNNKEGECEASEAGEFMCICLGAGLLLDSFVLVLGLGPPENASRSQTTGAREQPEREREREAK